MESRRIKCLQESTPHVPSDTDPKSALTEDKAPDYSPVLQKIVWRNVVIFTYAHLAAFYGLYLMIFKAKGLTTLSGEYLQYAVTVMRGTLLVAQLVEALRYKSEGRGFDSR